MAIKRPLGQYARVIAKAAINIPLLQLADSVLETSRAYETVSNFSGDHREALAALKGKRKPVFGRATAAA